MRSDMTLSERLESIRSSLIEARRYVLSDPRHVADCIKVAVLGMTVDSFRLGEFATPIGCLVGDLLDARQCLRSNPEVATAYLTTVIHSLGSLRSEIEKETVAAARDAELTQAYCRGVTTP